MKVELKLYLFDETKDNCLGYDFSQYIEMGYQEKLRLDGTIDTFGLNLVGLPFSEELAPTTKFILKILEDGVEINERHFIVQEDLVEKPIMSDNEYYIHHITFANPAIIAQQRPVDNIAITYKLQDVSLENNVLDVTSDILTAKTFTETNYLGQHSFGSNIFGNVNLQTRVGNYFNWVYTEYEYDEDTDIVSCDYVSKNNSNIATLKRNYIVGDGTSVVIGGTTYPTASAVVFTIPLLKLYVGQEMTKNYVVAGYVPTQFRIKKTNRTTGESIYIDYYDNTQANADIWFDVVPSSYVANQNNWVDVNPVPQEQTDVPNIYGMVRQNLYRELNPEQPYAQLYNYNVMVSQNYDTDYIDENTRFPQNHEVRINFDSNDTNVYDYEIEIRRKVIECNGEYLTNECNNYSVDKAGKYLWELATNVEKATYNDDNLNVYFKFTTYHKDNLRENLTLPSQETNAYFLFQKAQYASQTIYKTTNESFLDKELTFTLSDNNKALLKATPIVENFYQEKNLWEIFTEIGNYIHAKPIVKFNVGNQKDNFLLDFIPYGNYNLTDSKGIKNTIFNSRFVSEYISELTSYTNNLVQLSSSITEFVKCDTSTEDYLVYNDGALIKTKYPILQIDKLEMCRNVGGSIVYNDITDRLFEYGIWKVLPIDNQTPSKSNSIYYMYGENEIKGFQYLKPTVNQGEAVYPMKKIIADITGYSENLVNIASYYFRITYRTKNNVRLNQPRPDLRKYLLNSSFDSYPIHTQFNNQENRYVDSNALGNNLFGNLIRTGNSVYELTEWLEKSSDLSDYGDLVRIDGKDMFVSQVDRTYYTDHIEQKLELTQDFNRLSQIIGIPSEPRFYEISEQSSIKRNVNIEKYVVLTDIDYDDLTLDMISDYSQMLFTYFVRSGSYTLKNTLMAFKGDLNKTTDIESNNFSKAIVSPTLTYSHANTITYNWEMQDNFSAGNRYGENGTTFGNGWFSLYNFFKSGSSVQLQYQELTPVRYTDVYGRADLIDFSLVDSDNYRNPIKSENVYKFEPDADLIVANYGENSYYNHFHSTYATGSRQMTSLADMKDNSKGIYIVKDNRESLSFSYNINVIADSDRFVLSPKMFERQVGIESVRLVALFDDEIPKTASDIDTTNAIDLSFGWNFVGTIGFTYARLVRPLPTRKDGTDLTSDEVSRIKAIALVYGHTTFNTSKLIFGRNVSDLSASDKFRTWYLKDYDKSNARTNTTQINNYINGGILPQQE